MVAKLLTLQHIYMCCGVNILAKFDHFPKSIFWPSLFFFLTFCVRKHYKNRGFSTFLKIKKKTRANFQSQYFGQVGLFFWYPQLGQNIDFNLAKILTLEMAIFLSFFCFLKSAEIPIFIVFFCTSTKIWQKRGKKKNDNFSHFAKHRVIKKNRFVATPLLTKNWCFSTCVF